MRVSRKVVLIVVLVLLTTPNARDVAPARADAQATLGGIVEGDDVSLAEAGWFVEGTGTSFEITDSEYLNVTLTSSETVHVILESVPKMVSFMIESSSLATSTLLSFTGFQPKATYYRYQDGNLTESFATDSDGIYSYVQDITSPHHIFVVEDTATIYIRPDGTVYSDTGEPVPINVSVVDSVYTYTFTSNISETIIVRRSNVVIDGNGYTLEGSGSGNGFYASGASGITIKNVVVKGWEYGIALYRSSDNSISGNTIQDTWAGIQLQQCRGDNVSGNNIQDNNGGIRLRYQSYGYNVSGNTINNNGGGIFLWNASGSISGNTISNSITYGIHVDACKGNGNNISRNTIQNHSLGGISFVGGSRNNKISGNTIQNNNRHGIAVWEPSLNNSVSGNTIQDNGRNGIYLSKSSSNSISGNTIQDNGRNGIALWGSSGNSILCNTISNNRNGIILWGSSSNTVYHNNIINNSRQAVDTNPAANDWHHPDLLEGNYWSDYLGVDDGSGTGKHAIADDGIGDTDIPWPELDYDNYPLMYPWCSPIGHMYALISDIGAMGLEPRVERDLVTVLRVAIRLLDYDKEYGEVMLLRVFVIKVTVYEHLDKLTSAQANQLRASAYEIIELI